MIRGVDFAVWVGGMVLTLSAFPPPLTSQDLLAGTEFRLVSAEVRGDTIEYRYVLNVPVAVEASVAEIALAATDVHDARMYKPPLRHTGEFKERRNDYDTNPPPNPPLPVVPAGVDVPADWRGLVSHDGWMSWYDLFALGPYDGGSGVPPGDTLSVAFRSTYLPGVRRWRAAPDFDSCCSEPVLDEYGEIEGYNLPPLNAATGYTVGPTTAPGAVELSALETQLISSCVTLGWITNAGICNSLQVKLAAAAANLAAGNRTAASNELQAFANELDALNVKFISPEAYWMLKINAGALAADPR